MWVCEHRNHLEINPGQNSVHIIHHKARDKYSMALAIPARIQDGSFVIYVHHFANLEMRDIINLVTIDCIPTILCNNNTFFFPSNNVLCNYVYKTVLFYSIKSKQILKHMSYFLLLM